MEDYVTAAAVERETGVSRGRVMRLAMLGIVQTRPRAGYAPLFNVADVRAYLAGEPSAGAASAPAHVRT